MQDLTKRFLLIAFLFTIINVKAQEDLLSQLEKQQEAQTNFTTATFKATHLVSGQSIETNAGGELNFLIQHRFGTLNSGWRDLFGLDNSNIRLSFEYGLTDDINIGLSRASYQKTYDAFAKWKFLKQQSGKENFPFTATWVSSMYVNAAEWTDLERDNLSSSRLGYHHALLLARKFKDKFSLQLMPTLVHRNLVKTKADKNTLMALGSGASVKLTGSTRFNVEYYYLFPYQTPSQNLSNALSFGFDIETGGHVFQLHISNSRAMTEKFLIDDTTGNWDKGDIYFGFNISRIFTLKKPEAIGE